MRVMFGDIRCYAVKGLFFIEKRQIGAAAVFRLFFERRAEKPFDLTPPFGKNVLAFCRESVARTLKSCRYCLINIWLRRGAQQLAAYEKKQIALTHGKPADIRFFYLHCRDNGVMVGHILIRDHAADIREEIAATVKGRQFCCKVKDADRRFRHVGGEITAVGTGIGQQFLFVKALRIVKRLFCRVAENAVRLAL